MKSSQQIPTSSIFNLDETGMQQKGNRLRNVVIPKNVDARVRKITAANEYHVTLVATIFADGSRLPPFFILPGQRKSAEPRFYEPGSENKQLLGTPQGSAFSMSESGYMTDEIWQTEFVPYLVRHVNMRRSNSMQWALGVCDGYGSHTMTAEALEMLLSNRIHLLCMPSHTSTVLQPLDVTVFA